MKSYKSFTGARGGLAVLPPLEEREDRELESSDSESCSSLDQHQASGYPVDLLGVSWGSYLYSSPPTRGEGKTDQELSGPKLPVSHGEVTGSSRERPDPVGKTSPTIAEAANEPHPLMQHLQGLMTVMARSKAELIKCGLDVSSLTPLCNATTASHRELQELMAALGSGPECNTALLSSDLVHNLVEYLKEVLQGLVAQGKKLNVQAAFLQQTAKQLSRGQQESLKQQKEIQDAIKASRSQLDLEKQHLERERHCIEEAKVELKKSLLEAEERLAQAEARKKKGRMASPHTVAQGRSQLVALAKTQNQQSRLEKAFVRQQREIRSLQQAHDLTKSGLLAVQDHATKLQRKLARQIQEVTTATHGMKDSGSEWANQPVAQQFPPAERKSYHNTSKGQVKTTLKGILAAQKNLSTEIEQMQRQFSEQHTTEQRLSRELEQSCQQLLQTSTQLKSHTASIRGGRKPSKIQHNEAPVSQTPAPTQNISRTESLTLPKIPQSNPPPRKTSQPKRLPHYQFSKAELFALAKFDDHETAEQVMTWLQSQGRLQH